MSKEENKTYAIAEILGKQYKVNVGDVISVEKINEEAGTKVDFNVLMTVNNGAIDTTVKTGTAEVVSHGKAAKIVVFKYKAKKNVRKKKGHRQQFTKIKILSI